MNTEQWVRRLNALARKMDDYCEATHPSAWAESTKKDRAAWKEIARKPEGGAK